MVEAHPLRCETCQRRVGLINGLGDCPIGVPHHCDTAEAYTLEKVGCASHSAAKESVAVLEKCMAYSINNENPGWVKIADIKTALFGEDWPHQDMLQEFPFRSIPKKELRSQHKER